MSNSGQEFQHACYGTWELHRELLQKGIDTLHGRRHARLYFDFVLPRTLTIPLGVKVNASECVGCGYLKPLVFDER